MSETLIAKAIKTINQKAFGSPFRGDFIILKVHPVGRKDHGWDGHNDGHKGQGLPDVVLVVRNDRGEGLCHRM